MIKKMIGLKGALLALVILFAQINMTAAADYYYGCEAKKEALEEQLSYARQHGNHNRVRGLERAIYNVDRYCGAELDNRLEHSSSQSNAPVSSRGCDAKKAALQRELSYARQYSHHNRVRGLERAISKVDRYCNDDSLRRDLDQDIAKLERKVADKEYDLNRAIERGDSRKIVKQEEKLASLLEELTEKRAERAAYFN